MAEQLNKVCASPASWEVYDYPVYCLGCETAVPAGEHCKCCPDCRLHPCEFECDPIPAGAMPIAIIQDSHFGNGFFIPFGRWNDTDTDLYYADATRYAQDMG